MNSQYQQLYQYQLVPPTMQGIPTQGTTSQVASQPMFSNFPIPMIPPPPPPNFLGKAVEASYSKASDIHSKSLSSEKCSVHSGEDGNLESQLKLKCEEIQSDNDVANNSSAASNVASTPSVTASTPAPFVSGVYAGAFAQQAMPQATVSGSSVSGAQTQYVLTHGVPSYSLPQAPKVMYLPPAVPQGAVPGGSYYLQQPGGTPMVVTDHTGKHVIIGGGTMQQPLQYQIGSPYGPKPAMPQQYVLTSNPYYNTTQANAGAAVHPLYAPVQGVLPTAQNPALTSMGGTVPTAPNSQVYYYQY